MKEACIPSLKTIRLKVTELCSGQALGDADTDAAYKSNPYMSPFQGNTKMIVTLPYSKVQTIVQACNELKSKQFAKIQIARVLRLMVSSFSAVEYGRLHYRIIKRAKIKA
jgi:hypothetical protein